MSEQIIPVTSGQVIVDTSIVPFIRKGDIEFNANDLKPYKEVNFFFDETNVNRFVQRPSEIIIAGTGTTANIFSKKEGFINDTTGAYFTVLDYNANNVIYVNENYLTFNISAVSPALASGDYSEGDIVYQNGTGIAGTNASSSTFSGKVVYWDSVKQFLVVAPQSGTVNTQSGAANAIFKVSGRSANISTVLGNTASDRFTSGDKFIAVKNASKYDFVSFYNNYSGQIPTSNNNLYYVALPSNVSIDALNEEIKITSGTGIGQVRLIANISGSVVGLNSALSVATTNDSRYTIGNSVVDEFGRLSGVFNIPEDPLMKFRTGERLFTITDANDYLDADAEMKATAKYVASGILNKTQEVRFTPVVVQIPSIAPGQPPVVRPPPSTPTPPPVTIVPNQTPPTRRRRRRDPVAQTFFTPEAKSVKQNYGIFVSSVDLFFKAKPLSFAPQLPVTVRIVTTDNGYPTENIVAAATVYPDAVNITDGVVTLPSSSDSTTYTKFTFANPVYLAPHSEYAIVVFSESPDYEVWISELGENIIGTNRRVSEQPYAGSFFRSQNASTWTPFQNQDLMFVINKAVFSTNPATATFNIEALSANVYLDELLLHSTDLSFPSTELAYAVLTTYAKTTSQDGYLDITPNEFYNFGADLRTSSSTNNRRRVALGGNSNSLLVEVRLSTTDNTVSPMFNTERLSLVGIENLINNAELSSNNITVTSPGGYHSNAANIVVTISAPQISGGTTATANVLASQLTASGNVTGINIITGGSGYIENPTITIAEPGVTNPNATAVVISENSNFGGNAKARYLTRKISLADGFDAGDLRVFLRAIKPAGTNILVYYKVLSATDQDIFFNKKWVKMQVDKDLYSMDQESVIELQYKASELGGKLSYIENGVEYPLGGKFKNFAIKIVLLSEDSTVVPIVQNFRAIATPEG